MGAMGHEYGVFVGKPEGKRQLEIPRHRCEDNIRMVLKGIGWKVVNWIHLSQDRDQSWALVSTVRNLRIP